MPFEPPTLPALITELLSTLGAIQTPSRDLQSRLVERIRVAPIDEIKLGLHALWPFTPHPQGRLAENSVLRTQEDAVSDRSSRRCEEWMGQWGIEWEAKVPKFLELEEKALRQLREDFARIHKAGAALLHRVRPSFCH